MPNRKIKHLFFDLDQTLWDYQANARELLEEILREYNLVGRNGLTLESFMRVYIPINQQVWELYRSDRISMSDLRIKRFEQVLRAFSIFDRQLAEAISEQFTKNTPTKKNLVPGAMDLLKSVYGRYTLSVITNGFDQVQKFKMNHTGLGRYIGNITTSEEAEAKKPSPLIFQKAMEKIGVTDPNECLMVGDDVAADIIGAQKVGMHVLLFDPEKNSTDLAPVGTPAVSTLTDILPLLEQ